MPSRLRIVLACCLLGSPILIAQDNPLANDIAVLRSSGLDTDGPGLVKFFKKRTIAEGTRTKVQHLIGKLSDDDFETRQKATEQLAEMGAVARAQLTQTLKDTTDAEVRRRARWALEKIGTAASEANFIPAAARVLAARKPADACQVLLDFLPSVEEPEVAEEVARALAPMALGKDGKPEKAVLLALSDRYPIKRYAAADALIRVGGKAHRPAVHKLLEDEKVGIRRRVAVALLEAKDKAALPALLKLLASDSSEEAAAAEEALLLVAGDKAPPAPDSDKPAARERYRTAWEAWYKETGAKLDLAKIDLHDVGRGFTLVAMLDRTGTTGKVQEWDREGRTRWTISNLRYPIHVAKTRRDRVLICEYNGNIVTERDLKGNILWTKNVPYQVVSAQRLKNGNTFVVCRNVLLEYDKTGREVKRINRTSYDVIAAEQQRDGTILVVTNSGQFQKLDKTGTVLKSHNIGPISSLIGMKIHFLPAGGVVIPDYSRSKIREYDAEGRLVTEFDAFFGGVAVGIRGRPALVHKLADGNYLVGNRTDSNIRTVDKTGKQLSTQSTEGRPIYVDRR